MAEKQIVGEIGENGEISAETFGFNGPSCLDALDKLLKGFDKGDTEKKPDFYKHAGITTTNKITNNN